MTFILTGSFAAHAEDTEIFSNVSVANPPNVLVVLDNSGSMTNVIEGTTQTRMQALTAAFGAFVNNAEIKDINIGLMAFSNGDNGPRPHGISVPVSPIDDPIYPIMISNLIDASYSTGDNQGFFTLADDNLPDPTGELSGQTVREYLPEVIGDWEANGGTPIVDALHEAALYFKGESPKWGANSASKVNAAHPSSYSGSYLTDTIRELTGNTKVCVDATCGDNCQAITTRSQCSSGETSCYTGNNCTVATSTNTAWCNLGSSADCLASNTAYESCTEETDTDCSTTCSSTYDPETGACLGEEVASCTEETYFECSYTEERTTCERDKFECDEVKYSENTTGLASYISPINQVCQNNILILMSDGTPNADMSESETTAVRDEIKTLIGRTDDCADVAGQVVPTTGLNTLADGRCGPELAAHLATVDQDDDEDYENVVKTYTVGFAVEDRPEAEAYLQSLAESGDGEYYPAANEEDLAEAFISALSDAESKSKSFAAPVYTVDPNSLLSHGNDIYLPLFQNTDFPAWAGNLKKFKLSDAGVILDANDAPAFDDAGSLKPAAVDFWMPPGSTGATDADPITAGGFANNITPSTRTLLTDDGSSIIPLNDTTVTKTLLGDAAMTDADKTTLLNYIQGYEDDGTPRKAIGDILHSEPTFISYGPDTKRLFFGTNEGYLHAIDAADASTTGTGGQEMFAFMPSSLLQNIDGMHENALAGSGELTRIYGVDGSISAIISDSNKNGSVDGTDTATLVFGLRRGGSEYYALDVSDPDLPPSLKWKISATDIDFAELGETWSKPKHAQLRYLQSGTAVLTDVLVFGGGYDNSLDQEDLSARTADTKGRAVFIVNLDTGALVWSSVGKGETISNSIPGDIRTLDMDDDGSIDRLYFGDTGCNIWRADLTAYDNEPGRTRYDVSNNSLVTHFAELGGSGTDPDPRKFFFEPDVSVFNSGGQEALIVAIGSGYRPHPLSDSVSDRFYVLSDVNVRSVPTSTTAAITDGDLQESSTLNGDSFFPTHKGWYKELDTGVGEKSLASPLIFLSKVTFTTFAVGDSSTTIVDDSGCTVEGANVARAYVLDLMTGDATVNLDDNAGLDESVIVENGNILDTPQLIFNEPTNCTTDGCNYYVDLRVGNKSTPLIDKDTEGANNDLGDFLPKMYWLSK